MQTFLQVEDRKSLRTFLPTDFEITDWESLKPYYEQLVDFPTGTLADLEHLLKQRNELDAIVSEAYAWRYIEMTRHTLEKEKEERFQYFVKEVIPHISVFDDKLNRKIASHPNFGDLPDDPYLTFTRKLKRQIDLFREESIPLQTEMQTVAQQQSALNAAMTIEHEGKTLTMQQAGKMLEDSDRELRESVWRNMAGRRMQDREKLEGIFDKLVELRHTVANQAGYESFTAYKFDAMGRFDYTLADTHTFHDSVAKVITPIYEQLMQERKERLGLDTLRPWDMSVDIFDSEALHPFDDADDLLHKSMEALNRLNPYLGQMINIMSEKGYLDLESRPGKAPGGYNYPLAETGIPFIFMNAAGSQTDVVTMLHESGHAVHSFVTRDLPMTDFQHTPSEVAELASMTMELLCLDHYDVYYKDPKALKRAQKNQLIRCITIFPWIATIDAFQQWAYDNPTHTHEERNTAWVDLYKRFHGDAIDWTGLEEVREGLWLKQAHVFEVPFYYIEYAIAQLGAIAIWTRYRQHPEEALQQYLDALQLGYTRTIPEIYSKAGIQFDFTEDYTRFCVEECLKAYQAIAL